MKGVTRRWQLLCGAVAGPLFTLVFTLAGAVRPGYSALRHLVSGLALGPHGWVQVANFVVAGALLLPGATGLARAMRSESGTRWGPRLVAAAAILLASAALFAVEPVNGYPPGTPDRPVTYTFHGKVHAGISGVGFSLLVVATLVFARHFWWRGERGWAAYLGASAVVSLVGFVLMLLGIDQRMGLVALTGLFERIAFVAGFGWLTAVSLKLVPRRVADADRRSGRRRLHLATGA
jgi:hypothetical protein